MSCGRCGRPLSVCSRGCSHRTATTPSDKVSKGKALVSWSGARRHSQLQGVQGASTHSASAPGDLVQQPPLPILQVPLNTVERRRLEDGSSAECNFLPDRSMNKKGRLNVSSADPSAAPVLFWFEKEANISVATNRLIHAAVKSAVLHNRGSKVLVFSNSLDFSYFCAASSLSGWARERTLSATCQASVQRYDLGELLRPRDPVLAESVLKIANSVGSSKSVFGQVCMRGGGGGGGQVYTCIVPACPACLTHIPTSSHRCTSCPI